MRNGVPLYGESLLLPTRYTRVHASAQPANTWLAGQRGVHIPVYAESEASSTRSGSHARDLSRTCVACSNGTKSLARDNGEECVKSVIRARGKVQEFHLNV